MFDANIAMIKLYGFPEDLSPSKALELLNPLFKFTFVRHPFERFVAIFQGLAMDGVRWNESIWRHLNPG